MKADPWTPGEWSLDISRGVSGNGSFHLYLTDDTGRKLGALWGGQAEKEANGVLISRSPNMIALIRKMRAELSRIEDELYGENIGVSVDDSLITEADALERKVLNDG